MWFSAVGGPPGTYFKTTNKRRGSRKRRGKASTKSGCPAPLVRQERTLELRPLRLPEDATQATTSLRPTQVTHTKNVLKTVFCDPNGTPNVSQGMVSRPEGTDKTAKSNRKSDRARLDEDKYAFCPRCNAPVKFKNLARHLRRPHDLEERLANSERLRASPVPKKSPIKSKKRGKRQSPQNATIGRGDSVGSRSAREDFRQSTTIRWTRRAAITARIGRTAASAHTQCTTGSTMSPGLTREVVSGASRRPRGQVVPPRVLGEP